MHAGGFHHHSAHVAVAQRLAFGNILYEPNAYFCPFFDGDAHCGLRGLQRLAGMALTYRRTASKSDQGQRRLPAGTVGGSAHFDCQTAASVSGSGCCGTLYATGGFHQTVANGSFLTLSRLGADRCCSGRLAGHRHRSDTFGAKTVAAARLSVLAFCRGARSRMVPVGTGRTSSKSHSSFYPQSGRPAHDLYELRHES